MESDEKKIEYFIDKIMSEDFLEQPSLDFTNAVMSKVEAISTSDATVYKPLISKPVWILILGNFTALFGYVILGNNATTASWTDRLELPNVSFNFFENVSSNMSSTLMYAVVLLAIMISIQIPLLKHYFNKRMTF
ncbi:hypothetical protein HNV10_06585 [Winogradskyella litoriviva]|uniref:Uncharacterized protein n=1 Tax=Winogradskyella litoriviva TaxID=1220182 RepID=A0ABX2E3M5_9FLAO|nr:hypothetical protein [Winogradskyella litoriviva]NRD22900.1 hypothetical protein [Winogradskyella litoriviva]